MRVEWLRVGLKSLKQAQSLRPVLDVFSGKPEGRQKREMDGDARLEGDRNETMSSRNQGLLKQ